MLGNLGLSFMSIIATPENCHHFKHHSGHKFEKRVAILVDGGFYRWRAHTLFGDKTPTERADELFSYCLAQANGKHQIGDIYRIFYYDCMPSNETIYNPISKKQIDLVEIPRF